MIIVLKNHSEEYAAREIINAYYPKLKIEFSDTLPKNDDYVLSSYEYKDGIHCYYAKISIENDVKEYSETADSYNKTYIKKTVSRCLSELTGIHLPWGLLTGIRPSKMVREYMQHTHNRDCSAYLADVYEADADKSELAWNVAKNELGFINELPQDSVSLYVGIPFCPTRCLYCSFTSQSINYSNQLTEPYVEALKYEIEHISKMKYMNGKKIDTVYFGGGTPTALDEKQIDDLLAALNKSFDLSHAREITFEAGRPDTITREKLNIIKNHGISRISINPQTTKDATLNTIGRKHSTKHFFESYELARSMGFSHINCDIIAGLPDESVMDFQNTLNDLEVLDPESITVHTMSIKHGSYLDMKYNTYSLSASETVNTMLKCASKSMKKSGKYPYYMYRQKNMLGNLENVGYCKPHHECLYNIYIMEEVQSIIALGAGASTKIVNGNNIERVFNVKEVSEYIKRIDEMIKRKEALLE